MGRASADTRARRGAARRRPRRAGRSPEEGAGWRDPVAEPGLAPTQILLRGLLDDAGLFPPSPLPPFQAAQRNRSDRIIAHPMHSLRLMCPAGLLPELGRAVGGDGSGPAAGLGGPAGGALPSVLGVGGGEAFAGAVAIGDGGRIPRPRPGPGSPPVEVGVVLGPDGDAARTLAEDAPGLVPTCFEVPARPDEVRRVASLAHSGGLRREPRAVFFAMADSPWRLDAVAALSGARPLGVLVRCHGAPDAPPPRWAELASLIRACVHYDVPFRVASGEHPAVAPEPAADAPIRHGFLNLLLATAVAAAGGRTNEVIGALRTTDGARLAARLSALDTAAALTTRRFLTGIGARSTADPVRETADLGLLGSWAA
ncbi:hypothetical protein [Nocardiopsis sp. CNT-189]|uniref:hypothetical protein n=1 Tax=Nocardiopsis oceanisediminis TaxID=2816862 RepID=UPI003B3A0AD3